MTETSARAPARPLRRGGVRVELPGGDSEHFRNLELVRRNLSRRHRRGIAWAAVFQVSTVVGIVALCALLFNIINESFGLVALEYKVPPASVLPAGRTASDLTRDELLAILREHVSGGLLRRWDYERPVAERSQEDLLDLVLEEVLKRNTVRSWSLVESLFRSREIGRFVRENLPDAELEFRSWVSPGFVARPQSADPDRAGIRPAVLGTLWMIAVTVIVAFPLGVGAAVYLEEYANDTALNRLIQVNIYNLAGVPSIIYGMLGLAVFVRFMEPLTSGALFGVAHGTTANGRTIVSAGLTLALLILPLIIINSQEAIRAVPRSLRESSYGLGATRWQTIWHHVLPASMDRILTGTILAVSRAIGETAPLVVVGASTFVTVDPTSLFSKFTVLPIQIYQWTARPQAVFRNVAAAAIIVLLALLLSMNAAAVLLRNRYAALRREM